MDINKFHQRRADISIKLGIKLLKTVWRNYWNPDILSDIHKSELLFGIYMEAMVLYVLSFFFPDIAIGPIQHTMTENPRDVLQLRIEICFINIFLLDMNF